MGFFSSRRVADESKSYIHNDSSVSVSMVQVIRSRFVRSPICSVLLMVDSVLTMCAVDFVVWKVQRQGTRDAPSFNDHWQA